MTAPASPLYASGAFGRGELTIAYNAGGDNTRTTGPTGTGDSGNLQPYRSINYIIKT